VADELSGLEGAYLRDILDQPHSLKRTLAAQQVSRQLSEIAQRFQKGHFRTVVLTGMGASFHALHPLYIELVQQGLTAIMVETSELVHHQTRLLAPDNLIVVVSQSGRTVEAMRLLEENRGKSTVLAVTNTAGSPLAEQADATILTDAGAEFSVSCKTYVTVLMALHWLETILLQRDLVATRRALQESIPAVESYIASWKNHVRALVQLLEGIRHLFLVGRGPSLAAVGTGALIVKESAHFHAEAMSSAAFRHGPIEMLGPEVFVLVFAGSGKTTELNKRLLNDIRERKGRAEMASEDAELVPCRLPVVPSCVQPIVEILPVQMITLALAARVGREPGRFELASKVTTTE
jgi:glucosamine--fructose-6-phosphate aminotransferase (isomerizing)